MAIPIAMAKIVKVAVSRHCTYRACRVAKRSLSVPQARDAHADTGAMRDERGFTLTELIIVVMIIGILSLIAVGFHRLARDRAADAAAQTNIRVAVPAMEVYRADTGGYTGMTLAVLQSAYSPGVQGIEVVSADANGYCVRSTTPGRAWYRDGPSGPITTSNCA